MPAFVTDLIVVAVILAIVSGVVFYIVREKKRGAKCIGCPHAKSCGKCGKGGCGTT